MIRNNHARNTVYELVSWTLLLKPLHSVISPLIFFMYLVSIDGSDSLHQ